MKCDKYAKKIKQSEKKEKQFHNTVNVCVPMRRMNFLMSNNKNTTTKF